MSQTLSAIIDTAPLVVCLGPGGVGKTTVSAVLALHRAAVGQESLVLTIDPARRLADALNVSGLTNDPTRVHSFEKMHPTGTLSALMLDPAATFDHLIAMLVPNPQRRQTLMANRFYQHMSRTLAGTLEYMAVERLHELTKNQTYGAIVLDTPPTTNAIDFLQAPDRLNTFFNEKITKWFLPQREPTGLTSRLLSRAGATAQSLMGRVAGEDFVRETTEFFQTFRELLGDFGLRGQKVAALLRDPTTKFIVICSPEEERLREALTIDQHLKEFGRPADAFIVNRVDAAFLPDHHSAESIISRATQLLGGDNERERVSVFLHRLETLRKDRDETTQQQQQALAFLSRAAHNRPIFTAPNVPHGQSPRAGLLAIYVGLFGAS